MKPANYQRTNTESSSAQAFKEYLKSKAFSHSGINSRMVVIGMFWQWLEKENMEAEEVSYNDLLMYMKYKSKKGASQRTIQHYMGVVKHFYAHLLQEEKVSINPASDIEIKGVKRKILYHILETHKLHQLYNQYPEKTLRDRRNKVILGLLVYQGLKTEELVKLEVKSINLREGKIDVPGGIRSNSRDMKLEAHQVMEMYDYVLKGRNKILEMNPKRKSQSKGNTEQLFIAEGGNPPSGGLSNFMTQLMIKVRKLNPSVLNAKQIRASVITKWLKMYNLREVQYLAGHRYISSTESFLENDLEGLSEEVQQFHPLG
jgi:site-specific recombinase XerD